MLTENPSHSSVVPSYKDLIGKLYIIHNPIELKQFAYTVKNHEASSSSRAASSLLERVKISRDLQLDENEKRRTINNKNPVLITDAWEKNNGPTESRTYYIIRFLQNQILWQMPLGFMPGELRTSYYKPFSHFFRSVTQDD